MKNRFIIRDCGGNWLRFDKGGVYATTKANATQFTDWAVACSEWRKVRPTGSCEILDVTP